VVPDLHEALGQNVEQEAAEELVGRDGDGGRAAGAERDAAVVEGDEAPVGETDPVRVAAEIPEDLVGPAEGWLGIDVPSHAVEPVAQASEAARVGEGRCGAVEPELAGVVEADEASKELAAEQGAERAGREGGSSGACRPIGIRRGTALLR
jgi:hypothetical protein